MASLADTSVPPWAAGGATAAAPAPVPSEALDEEGTSYLIVGVGDQGQDLAERQAAAVPGKSTVILGADADAVADALATALESARVGVRVRLAGPAGDCLVLRGLAVTAGIEDDELHVTPAGVGPIKVFCAHCRAVTAADAAIGDVVPCAGCARGLVIYYHVSRLTGHFLGYMLDAEEAGA